MFGLRAWKIGRIMGIPISIDASWLIIFGLLTYELASFQFPSGLRQLRGIVPRNILGVEALALGAIASLFLFASVLAHELSHAWMALRRGIPVLGITLFLFGGVAQIADEPDRPSTEFWVAIMGPLMSLVLALIFASLWVWSQVIRIPFPQTSVLLVPILVVSAYLAQANGLLVVFNLLPGFPLDGGRLFRAVVWGLLQNVSRATFVAMLLGRLIAGLMIAGGLLLLVGLNVILSVRGQNLSSDLSGIWLILIGGFLWQASGEAYRSVQLRDQLRDVTVERLMDTQVERVPTNLPLLNFVDDFLLRQRAPVFAVDEANQTVGILGAAQIRRIPRPKWPDLRVQDAMVALSPASAVAPQDTALRVMQQLARLDGEREELPVMLDGQAIGLVGQEEIGRYLQWKR